jgi:hypothetical protein
MHKSVGNVQVNVKVTPEIVERAEKLIPYLTKENGFQAKRSEVLREALLLGLSALERRHAS